MKIITLIENHQNPTQGDLLSEHGLSFYIEKDGHVYMSDVGQSDKFAENASQMGVDLTMVEAVVISHHHYDHGGGLGRFFRENDQAKVYLKNLQAASVVAEDSSGSIRTIGLNDGLLRRHQSRIVMMTKTSEVMPGLHIITDIPNHHPKPRGDKRLKIKIGAKMKLDSFDHEIATVLDGEKGLVLLTGCAHNGVLNMIAATRATLPENPIQAVVGGFHLNHEDISKVRDIGKRLLAMPIPVIYTGHCTGEDAFDVLKDILGARLQRLYTGLEMTF